MLDESWYQHGIVSLRYIPGGLYAMLFKGLEWQDEVPWVVPGYIGTSVLLTMPILWWVFDARGRLAVVAGITAALILLPNLAHGNPGFAQLGYRYIVDALPLLWVMLGLAFRERLSRAAAVAMLGGRRRHVVAVHGRVAGLPGLTAAHVIRTGPQPPQVQPGRVERG